MVTELFVPRRELIVPKPPTRIKLDMAFGVGAGTTLFDKSRYRSHGAITGAQWATGLHGYALDFIPATPSYVEIPATETQLDFTSQAFSIVARIRIDDLTAHRIVFCRGLYQVDGWYLYVWSNGALALYTNQSTKSQQTTSAAGAITTATWYTIGASRSGASAQVFRNGVDITSGAGAHIDPATSARSAKIGICDDKATSPFDGKIEFLRIFGGIALSTSEHLAYHNALA